AGLRDHRAVNAAHDVEWLRADAAVLLSDADAVARYVERTHTAVPGIPSVMQRKAIEVRAVVRVHGERPAEPFVERDVERRHADERHPVRLDPATADVRLVPGEQVGPWEVRVDQQQGIPVRGA